MTKATKPSTLVKTFPKNIYLSISFISASFSDATYIMQVVTNNCGFMFMFIYTPIIVYLHNKNLYTVRSMKSAISLIYIAIHKSFDCGFE